MAATLGGTGFSSMTRMFHRCYTLPEHSRPASGRLGRTAYSPAVSTTEPQEYAGQQLGMPAAGPGSMAPLWRRAIGLLLDWGLVQLLSALAFGAQLGAGGVQAFVPLGILAVLNVLSITAFAATPGQALLGMQVLQVRPGSFPLQVLIRTVLLCLFVPAVLSDRHGRGFHDAAAGTVIVRRGGVRSERA